MEETVHDVILLLSGVGGGPAAETYLEAVSTAAEPVNISVGGADVMLSGGPGAAHAHRVLSARVAASNTTLLHRFTGHRNVATNFEGVEALLHTLVVGWRRKWQACDVLVMASSTHDYPSFRKPGHMATRYVPLVRATALAAATMYSCEPYGLPVQDPPPACACPGPLLLWKGESFAAHKSAQWLPVAEQARYEALVADALADTGVAFVNLTAPLAALPPITHNRDHHIGEAADRAAGGAGAMLWSSVATQALLGAACAPRATRCDVDPAWREKYVP